MTGSLIAGRVIAAALILTGALCFVAPEEFSARAMELFTAPTANVPLIYGLGTALVGMGIAALSERETAGRAALTACALVTLCMVGYFLFLTLRLQDWWIDDAGITFAYSRSLAEGLGLVAQPWMPPEEGYSSSVWMLTLSFLARMGIDIPTAAKTIGIACSAIAILLTSWIATRETRSPVTILVCGTGIACGPTVVWAASGQEHALQALLLFSVVGCAYLTSSWRWPAACVLAVLVLTRPEAPIIVITVFVAAVYLTRREGGALINAADAAIALIPFLAFLGLIAFRYTYFGDPLPNPYYAKSSGTALAGLFNPLGGGWEYILAGLRDTALVLVLALLFLLPHGQKPRWFVIAWAVLAGHIVFVVWAKGDWMSQYRFVMPIVPILMLLAGVGLQNLGTATIRRAFGIVAALVLTHTSLMELSRFASRPTTPLATVTEVGQNFRALAQELGIDDPVLAHHDAGGISYHRTIRLIDLGGLVNRTIAKNMDNKAFLEKHLLDELRPDFFFGAKNFAAASGFAETDAFDAGYVRLEFVNKDGMSPYLSHMRRDRVSDVPALTPVLDDAGKLVRVRIELPGAGEAANKAD